MSRRHRPALDPLVAPIGALAAVGVAAALTPLRDTVFGNTNGALVLAVVVAASASLGGRGAGALSACTAALSYNFFLTRPYLSLHIANPTDVVTVILLLVVGMVVGEFARNRGRRVEQLHESTERIERLERIARLLSSEMTHTELCDAIAAEIRTELDLADATWCPVAAPIGLPVMERSGWVPARIHRHRPDGFELPADGVELPVSFAGARLGAIRLVPRPDTGVSADQRRVALALADLLASALARGRLA